MKSLFSTLAIILIACVANANTVSVTPTTTGYTTTSTTTSGTMTVSNTSNRGYAVFNLATAGIPEAATITSVKLVFTYTVSGAGSPTQTVYGYAGDISALSASSLYVAAITPNVMYSSAWGTSSTTKTLSSTAAADTFIKHNIGNTVSVTWVEQSSTYIYSIAGGSSVQLVITYSCSTPTGVSITSSGSTVCSGATETLAGHATYGASYSWAGPNSFASSSISPAPFTVSTLSAGVYTFTATSNCLVSTAVTYTLTVKTAPTAISGASILCVGSTTTFTDATPGGTWSSSSLARATIGSTTGIATGISASTLTISYSTGCGSPAVKALATKGAPAAITGAAMVCAGATTTLSDATAGGTWTSSNTAVASVNSSTGKVSGIAAGTATITYNNGGCGMVYHNETINSGPGTTTGSSVLCTGLTTTLANTIAGGTWSSSSAAKATVAATTGIVKGVAAGTVNISYSTGCGTSAVFPMTVNASPAAIGGSPSVCSGATVTLSDASSGGTWSSSNTSIASISTTGVTRGVAQGIVNISYTKTGCSAIKSFNVLTSPGAIGGPSNLCTSTPVTYTNAALYGSWSSSTTGVAVVNDSTGLVTGVANGSAIIIYSTGCGYNAYKTISVITTPVAITGTPSICQGATTALHDATAGGTWSTSNAGIASINSSGLLSGIAQGTATITYSISGCSSSVSSTITGIPAPITGITGICNGSVSTLSDTITSGTWSSSNLSVANVSTSGFVTSLSPGMSTISYSTGCGAAATTSMRIDGIPTVIIGSTSICTGNFTTFSSDIPGGRWISTDPTIASISSSTGVIEGLTDGHITINYTLTNTCGTTILSKPAIVAQTGEWNGSSSMDWNDTLNWPCGVIPNSTIDATIPAGTPFLPNFSTATFQVKSLTIDSNVHISISGDALIDVKGNLTNNGIIDGDGYVNLSNTLAAQTIFGKGYISNLTLNNPRGANINATDTVYLTDALKLNTGTLLTNSGLVLVSTMFATGRIAPITGGNIAGNVTAQQYFEGGRRAFRFYGHPFSTNVALSQIESYIDVTGPGGSANGFTTTRSNAPSCFWYNTALGNSAVAYDPGWQNFTSAYITSDTNAFKQYEGIRLFVRGTKGQGLGYDSYTPGATTISISGEVNTGNQTIVMHKGANSDYNQLSNPYPSPTDIGTVINNARTAGHIAGAAFYVWNPFLGSAGAYEPKPIGMTYVLAENSSFQVRASIEGATLNFNENNKAVNADETLLRNAATQFIELDIFDSSNHQWDMTYINFNNSATNNEDVNDDATKAVNPDLNFYSLSANNVKLSIDARPYTNTTIIPLGFTTTYAQQYSIRAASMVLPAGGRLFLHDKFTSTYTAMEQGTEYKFNITSDPASQGEKRFELTTTDGTTSIALSNGLNVTMSPNPATNQVNIGFTGSSKDNTTINVLNVSGATVMNRNLGIQTNGQVTLELNDFPSGIYMVEISSGDQKTTQKLVKE